MVEAALRRTQERIRANKGNAGAKVLLFLGVGDDDEKRQCSVSVLLTLLLRLINQPGARRVQRVPNGRQRRVRLVGERVC